MYKKQVLGSLLTTVIQTCNYNLPTQRKHASLNDGGLKFPTKTNPTALNINHYCV